VRPSALEEDDYRKQLRDLRAQLSDVERQPDEQKVDEQKVLEATRLAQDIPAAWETASPDQRRRIVRSVFESSGSAREGSSACGRGQPRATARAHQFDTAVPTGV
jgi:hypothetical protein